jgi:hypothetical protein
VLYGAVPASREARPTLVRAIGQLSYETSGELFFKHLLNLTDLRLDFAAELFVEPFGLKLGVIRDLADLLFDRFLHFVNTALNLILGAVFHLSSPLPYFQASYTADPPPLRLERTAFIQRTAPERNDSGGGRQDAQ